MHTYWHFVSYVGYCSLQLKLDCLKSLFRVQVRNFIIKGKKRETVYNSNYLITECQTRKKHKTNILFHAVKNP